MVFSTQLEAKRHPIQFATRLNRRSLRLGFEAIATTRGATGGEIGHGSISFRWDFGALLCQPGLRRQTILQSQGERSMQDREHSALLQQDDDPEWQEGVRHPINRSGQYGHHLQTRGSLVMAVLLKPCAQLTTLDAFFTGSVGPRSDAIGIVAESLPLQRGRVEWGPS